MLRRLIKDKKGLFYFSLLVVLQNIRGFITTPNESAKTREHVM